MTSLEIIGFLVFAPVPDDPGFRHFFYSIIFYLFVHRKISLLTGSDMYLQTGRDGRGKIVGSLSSGKNEKLVHYPVHLEKHGEFSVK